MRLFAVKLVSDFGSRIGAERKVAAETAEDAIAKALAHYRMVNNGADCRVEAVQDEGTVLL